MAKKERLILNSEEISSVLKRIAHEIIEKNRGVKDLCIVGIRTRGVYIAQRLVSIIKKVEGAEIPLGILDTTLYRDDVGSIADQPLIKITDIPFDITNKKIVLVDDVLFTGRTIRSALDGLIDFGRPKSIQLAVLIDRGHRELPIQADFVGETVATSFKELIEVKLKEEDDLDEVTVVQKE